MAQHSTQTFLILLLLQGSVGLEWASTGPPNNGTINATCSGQDVILAWNFTLFAEEHLMNVEWHFEPTNGSEAILATQTMGVFFPAPSAAHKLQFIPDAGIRLHKFSIADVGTYTVHVNLNVHGSVVTDVQTVHVQLSDGSVTTDGELHARMLPEAVYDNSTQQFHVQLACGDFNPDWAHVVDVMWKTPAHGILNSTGYDNNGYFYLHLPNPVQNGAYTCFLDNSSNPVSECLPSCSPLRSGATIRVGAIEAKMALMDAELMSLKAKLLQQVYFFAVPSGEKWDDASPLYDLVVHNVGSGYNSSTGRFTAPVSGLYLFMLTADSASSDLHVKVTLYVSNGDYVSVLGIGNASGSNQLVVHLSAGDYAYVKLEHAPLESYDDSSFVGVLIQADI